MADASGLTLDEVAARRAAGQINEVKQPASRSVADILRENVFTFFNAILTVCFVAVLFVGDVRDGFFYGVVIVNALIGIVQELRAKFVLERLALLAAPTSTVRRDGAAVNIPIEQIVLDDVLILRPGDQIPADACTLASTGLSLDESMLTGESDPVAKDAGEALLSGSHVIGGTGYARVTAVGADSYANKLTSEIRRHSLVHSELRDTVNRILVYISWILGPVIVITIVGRIFAYGGVHQLVYGGQWRRAVLDAVASVVGMIPEGLVLLISLAFGVAAIQLATKKVLVQELAAVEVLARVDVLCLDKTGTLTSGELAFDRLIAFAGIHESESAIALAAFGSDDAGNATARLLAQHFSASGVLVERRLPFSSATKYSGVQFSTGGQATAWFLGAPERLLAPQSLERTEADRMAATGRRTLALVRSTAALPAVTSAQQPDVTTLRPAALVIFAETIREDAPQTLRYFKSQGVRSIIMSGDNPVTVAALAGPLGIGGDAVDASGLDTDDALAAALEGSNIFGRVSPEQKRAAIGLLRTAGRTVGMTGDGVNDAMAIKDADLGIAMGTATAATKAVSRIVLLDNRFDRLPDVLALGRRVIANVERVANIFLAKTVYGIILALVSAATFMPFPFLPRQLTLVSSLAIGIPSFLLALAPNRRLYTPGVLRRILRYSIPTGIIAACACLLSFIPMHLLQVERHEARSVATVTLFCVSLWILSVLTRPLSGARFALLAAVIASFVLVCVIPFTRTFFMMDVYANLTLVYGIAVGAVGAVGIELFYRFAKRRSLVFDRE
ncbi:HAD-IC family P-type ATPase [Rathayibacter soli]|uniref:HAD-IC family P-type ATPase n=1 Tax=Rathayibacter soli TaxID=3144168 RepID=UPI0027E4C13F|nr:HAD-IC family P-type ATPase [Glaciibacter superstes]